MRTPEEIKQGLQHCAGDGCEGCSYETDCYGADGLTKLPGDALRYIMQLEAELKVARNQQKMTDDACAYTVSRLKAELIATRVQLAKDGDLCRICKAQRAQDCVGDCIGCDNTECCCKRCIDTDGKEGFEWDGGADDDV